METILLEKVSKRIVEDADLRYFLERNHSLSESQELLLSYYLDKKLAMANVKELIPYDLDKPTLDKISKLIDAGQNATEAEAIVWLSDNGFGKVVKPEELSEDEKEFVNLRVKDRLMQLIKVNDELGYEKIKIIEFLFLAKNCHELHVWRTYYNWCHHNGFRDETTAIIVIGFRMFCQHGTGYLQAMIDFPEFASKLGHGISFGAFLDYFVIFAEAKITPQTIFDLFKTVGLPVPSNDYLSYQQAFGDKADEVVQYWIQHPYEVFDGFNRPRELNKRDFENFLWCTTISIEAAWYTLEAMKDEKVWLKLMDAFNVVYQNHSDKKFAILLFKWLYSIKPKTRVESVLVQINRLMSQGYQYMEAFILKAEQFPKKELISTLRQKGINDALKTIYVDEFGEELFTAIFDMNKDCRLIGTYKYSLVLMARSILSKSYSNDMNEMKKLLASLLGKLSFDQFQLMNWLAENDCTISLDTIKYISVMHEEMLKRINLSMKDIGKPYWPDLIRLVVEKSPMTKPWFTSAEVEFLISSLTPPNVINAVSYFLQCLREKYIKGQYFFPMNESNYAENSYFKHLVNLGANDSQLFKLCINYEYINDDFVKLWIKRRDGKTPKYELIEKTGWLSLYNHYLGYSIENCKNLMQVINEHEDAIPNALKALQVGIKFDKTIKLVLDETLTDAKITELLLEKTGVTANIP